ncbi:hypothetical protein DL764_008049 [Monosporascus ibericus]|uniref:Uncharacterized protein n=1 Tax=Monosporascus ibericus TaxID=155417 RepID=A0A4Q4SYI0_9PEZI|nr:hypothetical protein DL764_008049 [Monosporascus ibericus]
MAGQLTRNTRYHEVHPDADAAPGGRQSTPHTPEQPQEPVLAGTVLYGAREPGDARCRSPRAGSRRRRHAFPLPFHEPFLHLAATRLSRVTKSAPLRLTSRARVDCFSSMGEDGDAVTVSNSRPSSPGLAIPVLFTAWSTRPCGLSAVLKRSQRGTVGRRVRPYEARVRVDGSAARLRRRIVLLPQYLI